MKNGIFFMCNMVSVGMLSAIVGCGPAETNSGVETGDRIPRELQPLQGEWQLRSGSSDNSNFCHVVVDSNSLRIRCRMEPSDELFRCNAQVQSVDTEQGLLYLHGSSTPWHYDLKQEDGHAYLMLRFYQETEARWITVNLMPAEPA